MKKSEAWLQGYKDGKAPNEALLLEIDPPADYEGQQRLDYIIGYLVGARGARYDTLIGEIVAMSAP